MNWIILENLKDDSCNGMNRFIRQFAHGLSINSGYKVVVISIVQMSSFEFELVESLNVLSIKIPVPIYFINTVPNQMKLAKTILNLLIKYLPRSDKTIVHLNSISQYFIAKELVNYLNCKAILTQHYIERHIRENDSGLDIANQTYEFVCNVITVSEHLKTQLRCNNISSGKIRVIQNGIASNGLKISEKDKLFKKYGINKSYKIILYHSMANDTKGIEILSLTFDNFFTKNSNCRLVVIGNADLENLVINTRSFSSGINYLGDIPYADIIGLYQLAYMGVFLSLNEYSNSIVLDMLHNGLPIVAFNTNGINEIYQHGVNALLVNISHKDSETDIVLGGISFRKSVERLLTNEDVRNKFSHPALKRAKELFTCELMVRNYIKLSKEFYT